MTRWLTNRRILLISPQPWDHLPISKHHYAEALGQTNQVFFLEPPDHTLKPGKRRIEPSGLKGVQIIRWRPRTPKFLRFHMHGLYTRLIGTEARSLTRWLGGDLDLVWCFDFNVFPNLKAFGAHKTLFHPVDPLSNPHHIAVGASADLILSVSQQILDTFKTHPFRARKAVINHGIGPDFATLAQTLETPATENTGIHCGYFGNLNRKIINTDLLETVLRAHPEVTFNFWGPMHKDTLLAKQLAPLSNSIFHGPISKSKLAVASSRMDCFILAYVENEVESDRSNAHKLLEYFATGKIVVSTKMDCYNGKPDILAMSCEPGDRDFTKLFTRIISDLSNQNSTEKIALRKALAAEFTYEKNIAKIDAILHTLS